MGKANPNSPYAHIAFSGGEVKVEPVVSQNSKKANKGSLEYLLQNDQSFAKEFPELFTISQLQGDQDVQILFRGSQYVDKLKA